MTEVAAAGLCCLLLLLRCCDGRRRVHPLVGDGAGAVERLGGRGRHGRGDRDEGLEGKIVEIRFLQNDKLSQ